MKPVRSEGGTPILDCAVGRRGVVQAIVDGLRPPDLGLELHSIDPLPRAFRMMVEDRAFHVAEMPLTTLAMAIEHGKPLIGLPVILNRDFHYRSIVVGAHSDVREPRDLVGRKVGVRAYSQTTGVWARGLLRDEFGVEHSDVRWVTTEGAHVARYVDPEFVERAPEGKTLASLLESGDIDAAVIMDPKLGPDIARPMFPDAIDRARSAYDESGIYPVNHVMAIDTDVLDAIPEVASAIYSLFVDSKNAYRDRLRGSGPTDARDRYTLELQEQVLRGDFNPYGLEDNRASCEKLIDYALHQGLLSKPVSADKLFVGTDTTHPARHTFQDGS